MPTPDLDSIHHIAIPANDIAQAVAWYRNRFRCRVSHQDDTWALLEFDNVSLALVSPGQHPPQVAFIDPHAERHGELTPHRDGTHSIYVRDPGGNAIELLVPAEHEES